MMSASLRTIATPQSFTRDQLQSLVDWRHLRAMRVTANAIEARRTQTRVTLQSEHRRDRLDQRDDRRRLARRHCRSDPPGATRRATSPACKANSIRCRRSCATSSDFRAASSSRLVRSWPAPQSLGVLFELRQRCRERRMLFLHALLETDQEDRTAEHQVEAGDCADRRQPVAVPEVGDD